MKDFFIVVGLVLLTIIAGAYFLVTRPVKFLVEKIP